MPPRVRGVIYIYVHTSVYMYDIYIVICAYVLVEITENAGFNAAGVRGKTAASCMWCSNRWWFRGLAVRNESCHTYE